MVMFSRMLELPKQRSYFLFGARNTGKSTMIEGIYDHQHALVIDLLDSDEESRYARDPNELARQVEALPDHVTHVIIDEIQKVPKLLDIIQKLMKKSDKFFIMTGSSARKLKRGSANLLAGRAFIYHLFPLTCFELESVFNLDQALQWGTLPAIFACSNDTDRKEFLNAYSHTYLKEEILVEQVVRNLIPFRNFLEVAAQCNGQIINYSNIARDVGVDDKTIKNYFSVLEDTLIGFHLNAYHGSFRKRLNTKPKFYFIDPGVVRALSRQLSIPIAPKTYAYGCAFEHFIILECMRIADYQRTEYRFFYLRTHDDAEIDLVVERPGQALLCIEFKSTNALSPKDISAFIQLTRDMPNVEAVCFCNEKMPKQIEHVRVLPWQLGLKQYFYVL